MKFWVACVLLVTLDLAAGFIFMKLLYRWKQISFVFPSQSVQNSMTQSGEFRTNSSMIFDVDVDPKTSRVFVSMPKMYPGAPVTLAVVGQSDGALTPYPDWNTNQNGCNGLTSVFRMKIDECGRMWVIDSGRVDIMSSFVQKCPPQLVIYDLATNKMLRQYSFPNSTYIATSLLLNVVVEVNNNQCQNAFAYFADCTGYGLVVYDLAGNRSWRVNSNHFYADPRWGDYHIDGSTFYLMDGVMGMALSPTMQSNDRVLFFHSMASASECSVHTSILRNPANFPNGDNLVRDQFYFSPGQRTSQVAAEDMDKQGNLYFSQLVDNNINTWNWNSEYYTSNIHEIDGDYNIFQFVAGCKVIYRNGRAELWTLSNRYQKMATKTWNPNEYNFHIASGLL